MNQVEQTGGHLEAELQPAGFHTELPLFPQKDNFWRPIIPYMRQANDFKDYTSKNDEAITRIDKRFMESLDHIEERQSEYTQEHRSLSSSVTAAEAYLKIHQELVSKSVSASEINDFYLLCLDLNTRVSRFTVNALPKDYFSRPQSMMVQNRDIKLYILDLLKNQERKVPSWFEGDRAEWVIFLFNHAMFGKLLEPEISDKNGDTEHDFLSFTFSDSLPDWISTISTAEVDLEVVKDELDQDEKSKKATTEQIQQTYLQVKRLTEYSFQKKQTIEQYVQTSKEHLFQGVDSFTKIIIYLGYTKGYRDEVDIHKAFDFSDLSGIVSFLERRQLSSDEAAVSFVQQFLEKYPFEQELVALWIEKKIKEGKDADDFTATVPDWFVDFVTGSEDNNSRFFSELRKTNKRKHDAIKFGILPFTSILNDEEVEYLKELREDRPEMRLAEYIMEVADVIALHMRQIDFLGIPDVNFHRMNKDFSKFSKNLLIHNAELTHKDLNNAYEQYWFGEAVGGEEQVEKKDEIEEIVQEAEDFVQEVDVGRLSGWSLSYTPEYIIDANRLDTINGETLEECKEALGESMRRNHKSISIKLSSVINALDDFVGLPENVRALWPKKIIKGEEFYKIKRGAVRIFCKIDPEKKTLIFSLYQKQDFHYDL